MNRQQIIEQLQVVLESAGIDRSKADIRVQPAPYRGWNLAVITEAFRGKSQSQRREVVQSAISAIDVHWIDLLTPEESDWAGPLPGDIESENLPLWPEALARIARSDEGPIQFASDLDDDLTTPIVATFYSLRGGVGRSTALAHTARILAARRKRVLCIDMDFEAPALPVLFGCDSLVRPDMGVVDILIAFDQNESPDLLSHIIPVTDSSDHLFVLPAGRISADYARKLRSIDPGAWYREDQKNPLHKLLDSLANHPTFKPDVILLDARTGITDLSGPLLFDLSDIAIVTFFPHPQARLGTELLAKSLLHAVTRRQLANSTRVLPELRFLVSPVPTSAIPEVQARYRERPFDWISSWLEEFNSRRSQKGLESISANDITHFVNYRDDIATSDSVTGKRATLEVFDLVADWIQRFLRSPSEDRASYSIRDLKKRILAELKFSTGAAEDQSELLSEFVTTDAVREALDLNVPVVIGRKGTGKTALFRVLSQKDSPKPILVHAPEKLRSRHPWFLSPEGFAAIARIIGDTGSWRFFWSVYITIALDSQLESQPNEPRPIFLEGRGINSESDVCSVFQQMNETPGLSLKPRGWIFEKDRALAHSVQMLFDGLDTGFGNSRQDRERRKQSLEGLMDCLMTLDPNLEKIHFKVMIRDDIWRQLNFSNKSHLYGRTASLSWTDQAGFLKVVLKQAIHSEGFLQLPTLSQGAESDIDTWSLEQVQIAWNNLVGERMKGGQTTYTRNWVWNRLADANGNHAPRHILQIFHEALNWERLEEAKSPYERSIIRPRALTECLEAVSEQAVGALIEEFPELQPILDTLIRAARSPVDASLLEPHGDLVSLAIEVGLLGDYETSGDTTIRYKVPDLYRLGLKMHRKGQA